MCAGDFTIDLESQSVRILGGSDIRLTSLELRLLQLLLANSGHPIPTERLTMHVWGYRGMGDRQLLKQLVHRLRQKIEKDPADPRYLLTAPGVGYLLEPASK
jgi:DNA-binding response OmpR family regulator